MSETTNPDYPDDGARLAEAGAAPTQDQVNAALQDKAAEGPGEFDPDDVPPLVEFLSDLDIDELTLDDWETIERYSEQSFTDLLTLHRPIARIVVAVVAIQMARANGLTFEQAVPHARQIRARDVNWKTEPPPTLPAEAGWPTPKPSEQPATAGASGT